MEVHLLVFRSAEGRNRRPHLKRGSETGLWIVLQNTQARCCFSSPLAVPTPSRFAEKLHCVACRQPSSGFRIKPTPCYLPVRSSNATVVFLAQVS